MFSNRQFVNINRMIKIWFQFAVPKYFVTCQNNGMLYSKLKQPQPYTPLWLITLPTYIFIIPIIFVRFFDFGLNSFDNLVLNCQAFWRNKKMLSKFIDITFIDSYEIISCLEKWWYKHLVKMSIIWDYSFLNYYKDQKRKPIL